VSDLLVALGLVAVIEGLLYAIAPGAMKRMLKQVELLPESTMRAVGIGAMVLGVIVVWAVRG
jgi:uncharacterized protein YjeT (DUF2065 family)